MLIVCRRDLEAQDLERLATMLEPVAHDLRWARRAGRLVLVFREGSESGENLDRIVADPAVDYVLHNPSPAEITRIISRRDLLDLAVGSTAFLAGAALLAPLGLYLTAPAGDRPARGDLLIGRVDALQVGGSLRRVIDGEEHIIVRRSEDSFRALAATCTHSEVCLVDWDPERHQLVCPCHRGVFDLEGNVVSGPPPRPLARREVVVRNGAIYVRRSGR